MKEVYQSPDMELIKFDTEDIMTASEGGGDVDIQINSYLAYYKVS